MDQIEYLNHYTREVLREVAIGPGDHPEPGWRVSVAADSEVIFEHESGAWLGVKMIGIDLTKRRWVSSRGSLYTRDEVTWPNLAEVMESAMKELG